MKKQELLRKYLDDRCSHEELQRLYTYLQEDDEDEYREILYEIWSKLDQGRKVDKQTTERMFGNIKSTIVEMQGRKKDRPAAPFHKILNPYTRVAAAVTIVLIASVLIFRFFFYAPLITADTSYGKTRIVNLPDGSVVYLYANSKVRYYDDWSLVNHREVWLDGEAFFKVERKLEVQGRDKNDLVIVSDEVTTQKHKKFTVHTSNLDIEVIGTRFNVKDRRGEIQVVLNSGQIKLKTLARDLDAREEYLMKPGDLAQVGPNKPLAVKTVKEPDLYSLWKKNELYFDNLSLQEIAVELNDSHGIQLQFENQEIANLRFTGSTPVDNLQILLTTIQKSFELEIIQYKNEVMLKDKK